MNKFKIIWIPKHISNILIKKFYTIYKHNPYTLYLSLTELCHIFVTAVSLHATILTSHDVALYSKSYGNNTFIFSFFHNRDSLSNQWKDKKRDCRSTDSRRSIRIIQDIITQRNCRKSRRSNHRHFRSDVFFGCIFEFRSFQSPNPDGEDRIERHPG